MQFHDYKTMKPTGFKGTSEGFIEMYMQTNDDGSNLSMAATFRGAFELGWIRRERPFYNVYPIAVELCNKVSLNMKWGDITFPTTYLALRFSAGCEPLGIKTALVRVPSGCAGETKIECHRSRLLAASELQKIQLGGCLQCDETDWMWVYNHRSSADLRDRVVSESIDTGYGTEQELRKTRADRFAPHGCESQPDFLIRLLAFIGLLARGTDLITPAILAADREEYDATTDEARKRWLEQRAARRQGRGFDIGRSMEIERATSPHWRCPHIALFHTGPGRTVPVLKVRSGCVVVPKDMSQVPTGYLGTEKEGEEHKELPAVFRTPIPSKMRFRVMRRDGYRCRLCGMDADDGVTLECDHIIAVAKGGKTEPPNLWTLCRPCNNGKSDSDLHLALDENLAMEKARKEVKRGIRV